MFTVLNTTNVSIEAHIPESDLSRLASTRAASYEVPGTSPGRKPITSEGRGRFVFLGIQVDPVTRTVPLIYELNNRDNLRIGQLINLYVETAQIRNALAVPVPAVVEEGGRPVVFVQLGGETFEKRDVTLGISDGEWIQVLAGVEEGERVVTSGAYVVRLASMSSAIPSHGHAH